MPPPFLRFHHTSFLVTADPHGNSCTVFAAPRRWIAGFLFTTGCIGPSAPAPAGDPVLRARPSPPTVVSSHGKTTFAVAGSEAVVYVPAGVSREEAAGLVIFLHGAFRTVDAFVEGHRPLADETRVIVLAPFAFQGTWDAIRGNFSTDPVILDSALTWVFDRWQIDPARIAISGFSDGGTYALAVGRRNGNLFSRIAAYSPGFLIDVHAEGKPPIMISHGTLDDVLPIGATSRVIVPRLRELGHAVDYREFDGGHAVFGELVIDLMQSVGRRAEGSPGDPSLPDGAARCFPFGCDGARFPRHASFSRRAKHQLEQGIAVDRADAQLPAHQCAQPVCRR
jgi:phospholipase/carboxylesterase